MQMKRFCLAFFLSLTLALLAPMSSFAAPPDGGGPWADTVVSSSQALRKDGSAVLPARSDPTSTLGVAENDTVDSHFFSLGFGGSITLGFDNGISSGTLIVEATNPGYPPEKAKVEVSPDGSTWTLAGTVTQDGEVALPQNVRCAKFVRLTDVSNPSDFSDDTADAYDVDGVKALGDPCEVPTPTPPCDKNCCGDVTISQSNTTSVQTIISSSAISGGNKIKNNTNSTINLRTGKAKNKTLVAVTGGSNNVNTGGCCNKDCCGKANNITIQNNGAGSNNSVVVH